MAESLEEFLGLNNKYGATRVGGSLQCQECDEIVSEGLLNEETMVLVYRCSHNHQSKVKL